MILVGLLSDTHINVPEHKLPSQIKNAFKGVDLILHAGDIWIPSVLDDLESVAPVMAAWGDDDTEVELGNDKRMMKGNTLSLDGVAIWLSHVKPYYVSIYPRDRPFGSNSVKGTTDVVVFGHTHFADIEHYKDVLWINPGSATFPNYQRKLGTVGLLMLDSGEAEARIVQL